MEVTKGDGQNVRERKDTKANSCTNGARDGGNIRSRALAGSETKYCKRNSRGNTDYRLSLILFSSITRLLTTTIATATTATSTTKDILKNPFAVSNCNFNQSFLQCYKRTNNEMHFNLLILTARQLENFWETCIAKNILNWQQ